MNGTYRTWVLGGLVSTALVLSALPAPASNLDTLRAKKSFRAVTKGSPEPTIRGSWNDEMGSPPSQAHLTFSGGHSAGQFTSFEASWISPPTTSNENPEMSVDYKVAFANSAPKDVHLNQAFRARFVGGKWGKWVKQAIVLPASKASSAMDGYRIIVPLDKPKRLIFQWKVSGRFLLPAGVTGDFNLGVS
jgi:hypothetical protein